MISQPSEFEFYQVFLVLSTGNVNMDIIELLDSSNIDYLIEFNEVTKRNELLVSENNLSKAKGLWNAYVKQLINSVA
jgi:hypothetical protein